MYSMQFYRFYHSKKYSQYKTFVYLLPYLFFIWWDNRKTEKGHFHIAYSPHITSSCPRIHLSLRSRFNIYGKWVSTWVNECMYGWLKSSKRMDCVPLYYDHPAASSLPSLPSIWSRGRECEKRRIISFKI